MIRTSQECRFDVMWRIIDEMSMGSGPGANEDQTGRIGDETKGAAWVIDGATGLDTTIHVPGAESDAAWYAARLSQGFSRWSLRSDYPPAEVMARAVAEVAGDWAAVTSCPVDSLPPWAVPSAAATWIRWEGDTMEYAALGDCTFLVQLGDNTARMIGSDGPGVNEQALNQSVADMAAAGMNASHRWLSLLDQLRAARSRMNRPDGYWIFSLDPAAAAHARTGLLHLADGQPAAVLIATDGFYRLVTPYRLLTAAELLDSALEVGLRPLCQRLRDFEAADQDCRQIARIKPADDAAAILLTANR